MSDKRFTDGDAYDELLSSFYSSKDDNEVKDEVKNRGEVYFSSNTQHKKASQPQKKQQTQKPVNARSSAPVQKKASGRKKSKKKKNSSIHNSILAVIVVVVVFISAFLIKIPLMGCINDILAIDVSDTDFRVVLDKDMDAFEVIDELAEKKLINNPMFCKFFAKFMSLDTKTDREGNKKTIIFPAGTYFLNSSMGVEGMLNEIRTNGMDSNTVKVTFPEGFTVEQIFEKLDESGVCSAQSLHKVMDSDEFFSKYTFLSSVTEKALRYRVLEGYLYPDTYEFYIGEAPTSVIERFLNNFEARWSDAYNTRATELGYTIDEVMTVASILEKEAFDAEQMPIIASIIYNRLESSSFPFINCDSTAQYIDNFKESLEESGKYVELMKVYDTYQKTGLPIGPICCPGADAIHAALHPESTDYYYFCHDKEGKIYLASTDAEHQNNLQYLE